MGDRTIRDDDDDHDNESSDSKEWVGKSWEDDDDVDPTESTDEISRPLIPLESSVMPRSLA